LDRVEEIEKEVKQDFRNDGPLRVKRLAKESGQKPEVKKILKFGDANVNNSPSQNITQSISSTTRAGIGAIPLITSPSVSPSFTFGAVSPLLL